MKAEIAERIRLINKGQVPEGYKRETSYLYNTDWKFTTVSEVMEIRNNLRLPISEEERKNIQGIYPYYGPTKIQGYIDRFTVEGEHVLIGEDGDHFLKYKEKEMTLLIDGKFNVNNHAHILRGTDLCTTKWFYYYFQNRDIFSSLTRQGAGRYKLTKDALIKMKMVVPPLPEQQKIASILSTWDKAIELKEKLISEKKKQKTALMQELLTGKKRLDGFDGEWEEVRLGDVSEMSSGGTPKSTKEEYYGGKIPWLSISDMTKFGKYIEKTERYITEEGLKNSSARLFSKGVVLYAMYASIGECSIAKVELATSQAILGIRPKQMLNNEFLYYYLISIKEKQKLQGQIGTQSNLNAGIVKDITLKIPEVEEQKIIVSVFLLADKEISLLEKELQALKEQKKGLMQLLLTGIVRVN